MSADNPSFVVHKFRATGDAFSTNSSRIIKRNRQPLSCLPCRQRKLKCTRQQPCETCLKRGDEAVCIYGTKGPAITSQKHDGRSEAPNAKAQDRLKQLEELVMSMVGSGNITGGTNALTPESASDGDIQGVLSRDAAGEAPRYVGSTHWSAILENIQDLKATLSAEETPVESSVDADDGSDPADSDALFSSPHHLTLPQILSQYLPSRQHTDRLLSVYFNAQYLTIPVIHTYQFQSNYEKFCQDSSTASAHWTSMLFSICCLGAKLMQVSRGSSTPDDSTENPSKSFMDAAAHCIRLGGFRPCPWVVESLSLYAQCRYMQSMDPCREVGILYAIIVRLAYRMAYHRDPDNFQGQHKFSPFEGEMRRRVWAMTRQFDLMSSFQLGLPSNVAPDSWDTKFPRNLLDNDFDEDSKSLPPSRPESEPTKILYFIVKARLMGNFGHIINHTLSFKPLDDPNTISAPDFNIQQIDECIRSTFATVPICLRARPMSQSFADPPYLIMCRINCEFLYQKSLLVLHRKRMSQGDEDSTKTCIAAAVAIVRWMVDLYGEFGVGGQLERERWMMGSFTMNDFLLAVMVLCLVVSRSVRRNVEKDATDRDREEVNEWTNVLNLGYGVCVEEAKGSRESRKVAEAVGVLLRRIAPDSGLKALPLDSGRTTARDAAVDMPDGQLHGMEAGFPNQSHRSTSESAQADSSLPALFTHSSTSSTAPQFPERLQQNSDNSISYTTTVHNTSLFQRTDPSDPFHAFLFPSSQSATIDWTALDTFLANGEGFSPGPFEGSGVTDFLLPHGAGAGASTMDLETGFHNLLLPQNSYL